MVVESTPAASFVMAQSEFLLEFLIVTKESQIVEGHLMADHVHICISIPPKYVVSNVVGFIKGEERDLDRAGFSGAQAELHR